MTVTFAPDGSIWVFFQARAEITFYQFHESISAYNLIDECEEEMMQVNEYLFSFPLFLDVPYTTPLKKRRTHEYTGSL